MLFRNEYYFLSNFYPCDVFHTVETLHGDRLTWFPSSEHAYVASKTLSGREQIYVKSLTTGQAKRRGREEGFPLRSDWDDVKDMIMLRIIRNKFNPQDNPELVEKLLAIKGEIVEDNTWGDTYWGVCNGVGQNKLGKILMRVRDEIATDVRFNI